jgi:predicted DNA-binding ribbon-helix-helix protein
MPVSGGWIMGSSRLVNRNVTALHGRTSMRLEPEMWSALEEICQRESITLADLVRRIERTGHPGGRTSAVRVHVLNYFRSAATDNGHGDAGHGGGSPQGHGENHETNPEENWSQPHSAGRLASA